MQRPTGNLYIELMPAKNLTAASSIAVMCPSTSVWQNGSPTSSSASSRIRSRRRLHRPGRRRKPELCFDPPTASLGGTLVERRLQELIEAVRRAFPKRHPYHRMQLRGLHRRFDAFLTCTGSSRTKSGVSSGLRKRHPIFDAPSDKATSPAASHESAQQLVFASRSAGSKMPVSSMLRKHSHPSAFALLRRQLSHYFSKVRCSVLLCRPPPARVRGDCDGQTMVGRTRRRLGRRMAPPASRSVVLIFANLANEETVARFTIRPSDYALPQPQFPLLQSQKPARRVEPH